MEHHGASYHLMVKGLPASSATSPNGEVMGLDAPDTGGCPVSCGPGAARPWTTEESAAKATVAAVEKCIMVTECACGFVFVFVVICLCYVYMQ